MKKVLYTTLAIKEYEVAVKWNMLNASPVDPGNPDVDPLDPGDGDIDISDWD